MARKATPRTARKATAKKAAAHRVTPTARRNSRAATTKAQPRRKAGRTMSTETDTRPYNKAADLGSLNIKRHAEELHRSAGTVWSPPQGIVDALIDTYNNGGYVSTDVPTENAKALVSLIRRAAGTIEGMGSQVVPQEWDDGTTTVNFRGKEKSNRTGRPPQSR